MKLCKHILELSTSTCFPNFCQIGFEGVRGASFRSDIAIDDIKMSPGACEVSPTAEDIYESVQPGSVCTMFSTHSTEWFCLCCGTFSNNCLVSQRCTF